MFERLDLWRERVAALVPAPVAVDAHTHVAERVIHAGTDVLSSAPAHTRPAGVRQHAADAMAYLREHATAAYYRSVDPTPLAGVRPGAVAAAVAGCLAVGGGATYCVQHGTDRFAAFTGLAATANHEHKPKPHTRRARAAQTATPPVVTPSVTASPPTPTPTATPMNDASGDGDGDADVDATAGAGGSVRADVCGREQPDVRADQCVQVQAARGGAGRRAGGVRWTMTRDPREEKSMPRPAAVRVIAATGALSVLLVALASTSAWAGQFTVASCQADRVNFSTTAFNDFATRGMTIKRACNPEGPGLRGLVTANSTGRGAVPRGSVAMVAITAPTGTRFTTFRWAGSARRRDCRFALQLYAEGPDIKPISMRNVRANQHCPRPTRAQAAGYRSRTFNVNGATRIVQRVICEGGDGRKSCSARGANYIRTYQAAVGVADDQAPSATIAGDTPLATGAWVSGTQPLNYDAEDNVGVRAARLLSGDQASGPDQRPCVLATSDGAFASGVPCPNGAGHIDVDTRRFADGSQPVVVQVQDTAGNFGASPAVTARIDNTPPARVGVGVDGGDAWRNQNNFSVAWTNPPENDRAPIVAADYKLCPVSGGSCSQNETAG